MTKSFFYVEFYSKHQPPTAVRINSEKPLSTASIIKILNSKGYKNVSISYISGLLIDKKFRAKKISEFTNNGKNRAAIKNLEKVMSDPETASMMNALWASML